MEIQSFYYYSAAQTFWGSLNSVIATDCQLYALGKQCSRNSTTKAYIYKDVIGQVVGLFVAYKFKHFDDNYGIRGLKSIALLQLSLSVDMLLGQRPKHFVVLASFSNMLKNISWIGIGAINSKCMLNVSESSGVNIAEVYTCTNVYNTMASSLGLLCGTKLLERMPNVRSCMSRVSPIVSGLQAFTYWKMIEASRQQ